MMCDYVKLLEDMKKLQIKPEPIYCTSTTLCWCNDLTFRHPMTQIQDECLSPAEMLESYGSEMTATDIKYLNTLISREFIPD